MPPAAIGDCGDGAPVIKSAPLRKGRMAAKAVCVIGWPVEHSRSPLIHNYWIQEHGLDADYRREAVPPEEFASFISQLEDRGYIGANVTVPHKEAALALSSPDDQAEAVGAVNTLWRERGRLLSTNTDVEGFIANLDASVSKWDRGLRTALVLGAGGAARGVIYGLLGRECERILVVNRTLARAQALRDQFGEQVEPRPWREANGLLADVELVVNTTSLGMTGQPPLELDLAPLVPSAVIADLVYAPLETDLLKAARARDLRTADGLGMLLHQAVGGFERWFGIRPKVTEALRGLVEADLMREKK
jgi:shikimate dehydrogenase